MESSGALGQILAPILSLIMYEMGGIYYPFHILTLILIISLFVILELPVTKQSDKNDHNLKIYT